MTKKEIYDKALAALNQRRQDTYQTVQQHRAEVAEKIPEIQQMEYHLSQTTIQLSKMVLAKQSDISEVIPEIMRDNLNTQKRIAELLYRNGYPTDYLTPKHQCRVCEDRGYVKGARCDCLKTLVRQISAQEFNRTTSMTVCRFEDFSLQYYSGADYVQMQRILEFCRQYAEKFTERAPSILMMGNTGLGKTHLSLAIAGEAIARGYTVVYGTAQNLFTRIQSEQFGKGEPGADTTALVLDADLFILDDLGAEYESAFHQASFYNLINTRLNAGRPTILNTNLTLQQLETRYGNRVGSRLMTLYKCLKFAGKDVRQQKLLQSYDA